MSPLDAEAFSFLLILLLKAPSFGGSPKLEKATLMELFKELARSRKTHSPIDFLIYLKLGMILPLDGPTIRRLVEPSKAI